MLDQIDLPLVVSRHIKMLIVGPLLGRAVVVVVIVGEGFQIVQVAMKSQSGLVFQILAQLTKSKFSFLFRSLLFKMVKIKFFEIP